LRWPTELSNSSVRLGRRPWQVRKVSQVWCHPGHYPVEVEANPVGSEERRLVMEVHQVVEVRLWVRLCQA
jgi:hypothetical protein